MTLLMQQATTRESKAVQALLNERIQWLMDRGSAQWKGRDFQGKVDATIDAGLTWLLTDRGAPVGTITLSTVADQDFWKPSDLTPPALYVSKMATTLAQQGRGLGREMLNWAAEHAAAFGLPVLRWDAWRDNDALHRYYQQQGARYLRTVSVSHRQSGALFEIAYQPRRHRVATLTPISEFQIPGQERQQHIPADGAHGVGSPSEIQHTHLVPELLSPPTYSPLATEPEMLQAACDDKQQASIYYTGHDWNVRQFHSQPIAQWTVLSQLQIGLPYRVIHRAASTGCHLFLQGFDTKLTVC